MDFERGGGKFDNIVSSDDGESQQTKLTKGEALDILKNYNELKEHSGLLRSPIQTQHLSHYILMV